MNDQQDTRDKEPHPKEDLPAANDSGQSRQNDNQDTHHACEVPETYDEDIQTENTSRNPVRIPNDPPTVDDTPFQSPDTLDISDESHKLGAWGTVRLLFAHPSAGMFISIISHRWVLPLLLVLLIFGAGSCAKSLDDYHRYSDVATDIARQIGADLAPLKIQKGKLSWRESVGSFYHKRVNDSWSITAAPEPLEKYNNHIRYDRAPIDAQFTNLILLEDAVVLALGDDVNHQQLPLLKKQQLRLLEKLAPELVTVMDADSLQALVASMMLGLIPALAITYFIIFFGTALFCALIFGISSALFRRGMLRRFRDGVVIGINACLPASLMSMIWYWAAPRGWDFQTMFYISFIVYLIFVYRDSRKTLVYVNRDNNQGK